MSRKKTRSKDKNELLSVLHSGSNHSRCDALRELCPCRNNRVRDVAVWREICRTMLVGGMRERHQAAHAFGTLMEKAQSNAEWREILNAVQDDLDMVMRDTRASRMLLGQMKGHGHAHRGAAMQTYRRRRRVLDLATPAELANWVNRFLQLDGRQRVASHDPGVRRLWRWLRHRVEFQPDRGTQEDELIAKAHRYLPRLFQRPLHAS